MKLSHWSLYGLLTFLGGAALVCLLVVLGIHVVTRVNSMQEQALLERARVVTGILARELASPLLIDDLSAANEILQHALTEDPAISYLCFVAGDGTVASHTFAEGFPTGLREVWGRGVDGILRYRSDGGAFFDVARPVVSADLGVLHAGFSRASVGQGTMRIASGIAILFFIGTVAILTTIRVVAYHLSHPIYQLEQAVSDFPRIAAGKLDMPESGTREVMALIRGIVRMQERMETLDAERRSAVQRMIHAERLAALGELTAGLAHEIHNPLDGMQECLNYLDSEPGKSARAEKYYPMLRSGLERIGRTMRSLLNFARLGHDVNLEPCAVKSVMESLEQLLDMQLGGKDVKVGWGVDPACTCLCDRHSLAQASLNLVLNAVDAMEKSADPEVQISCQCDAQSVRLFFDDSGPGVAESLRQRIFEPFFTTKPMEKGTGLGLAVSREVVRACGGELTLAPGKSPLGGARFVIALQRVEAVKE